VLNSFNYFFSSSCWTVPLLQKAADDATALELTELEKELSETNTHKFGRDYAANLDALKD
jgi:hypothetical protein